MKMHPFALRLVALWITAFVVAFLVFGLSGFVLFLFLIFSLFPLLLRIRWIYRITAVFPLFIVLIMVPPLLFDRVSPSLRVRSDRTNLRTVVQEGVIRYRHLKMEFPASLADLSSDSQVRLPSACLTVRDDHEKCDLSQEGYLAFLFRRWRENRDAKPLWEQFSGDRCYLFVRPEPAASEDAVLLMTRPGLLYGNAVNVAYVDGTIETFEHGRWMRNSKVQTFLREYQERRKAQTSTGPSQKPD